MCRFGAKIISNLPRRQLGAHIFPSDSELDAFISWARWASSPIALILQVEVAFGSECAFSTWLSRRPCLCRTGAAQIRVHSFFVAVIDDSVPDQHRLAPSASL